MDEKNMKEDNKKRGMRIGEKEKNQTQRYGGEEENKEKKMVSKRKVNKKKKRKKEKEEKRKMWEHWSTRMHMQKH